MRPVLSRMPLCPLCLHDNPAEASVCEHCARYRFRDAEETDVQEPEPPTLEANRVKQVVENARFGDSDARRHSMPTLPVLPKLDVPPTGELATVPYRAKLVVIRGLKINAEYPLYPGANYLGRTAERPADIDLTGLEAPEQVWSSRQHAVVHSDEGVLSVEDLNSLNGTFVNRARLHAGKKYQLKDGDVIQIGTVQLRVTIIS
jgi:hypothetical protein